MVIAFCYVNRFVFVFAEVREEYRKEKRKRTKRRVNEIIVPRYAVAVRHEFTVETAKMKIKRGQWTIILEYIYNARN